MSFDVTAAKGVMDVPAFARRVGLSIPTIRRLIARGEIAHYRLGKRILFDERHAIEYLARHEHRPKAA